MQKPSLKNKSKRVQKKLFLGEFAVYGFEVSGQFTQGEDSDLDSCFDDFIDLVESRNLCFGGGYTKSYFNGFITHIDRYGSASEKDRQEIESWLLSRNNLSDIVVGSLSDAIYSV